MTRSNAREIAVHLIYAARLTREPVDAVLQTRFAETYYSCLSGENTAYREKPDEKQQTYIETVVRGVDLHRTELEEHLTRLSIGWNVNRISKLARSIMELAMYEILYMQDVPTNVAVHEAVLLAQKYEEPETVSFINGVLGSFVRSQEKPE